MKRTAEFQLTKDDANARENEDPDDPGTGFQKASESELATRKIKPLPSRLGRAAAPKPALSGFGAPSPANPFLAASTGSPFSSTPTTVPISVPPPSTDLFSKPVDTTRVAAAAAAPFSTTPSPSPFSIPSASPTSSGAATNTSKAFASILNTSSTNIFANPVSNPPPVNTIPSSPKATNGITESSMTKYYTNLRGLNVSLLDFIKKSVESDPFLDLTSALESYNTYRSKIQKEYEEASENEKTKSSAAGPTTSRFGGFGTSSASPWTQDIKASSTPVFGSSSNLSTNSFGSAKPATTSESSGSTAGATNVFGSPASGSPFGNLSKPANTSATAPTTTTTEKLSGFGSSTPAFQPTRLPFGFGSSSSTGSNPFSPPATNVFGPPASSTPVFGESADGSNSEKSPVVFGSTSSVGKNTGVFYGFGSGSSTPTKPAGSEAGSQETVVDDSAADTGSEGTESKEHLLGLLTPNPHDEEGAGEENEETVHAVKLKAYRMRKASEGDSGWAELGMGILRLKKDKDSSSRRILLRNSTNGKISINFKIYAGLKPSISKKALTFVGHSDGVSQTYCVRLASEEQANVLKAAMEREIEFVKSTASS